MRAGQDGGRRNSQSRDMRQGIQVRSTATAANPKPFLASSLKSGVVTLAFRAQSIISFEWKALPVNGQAVVGRQSNIPGAASILSAIVPVLVAARAAAGFGLPKRAAEFLADPSVVRGFPILMRGMDYYCCGSVPGRGPHRAKRAIEKWLDKDRKGTKYAVEADIRKYYDTLSPCTVMCFL